MTITKAKYTLGRGIAAVEFLFNGIPAFVPASVKSSIVELGVVPLDPFDNWETAVEVVPGDISDNRGPLTIIGATRDPDVLDLVVDFLISVDDGSFDTGPINV